MKARARKGRAHVRTMFVPQLRFPPLLWTTLRYQNPMPTFFGTRPETAHCTRCVHEQSGFDGHPHIQHTYISSPSSKFASLPRKAPDLPNAPLTHSLFVFHSKKRTQRCCRTYILLPLLSVVFVVCP